MPSYAKFDVWQNTAGVNYGTVLQVQSTTLTNTFSTTTLISSGGSAITGLSVNITPKYATSKILVFGHMVTGNSIYTQSYFKLKRTISATTTEIGGGTAVGSRPGVIAKAYFDSASVGQSAPFSYLDSPATVSQVTYQMFLGTENASYSAHINRTETDGDNVFGARGASTITVMEIAQ